MQEIVEFFRSFWVVWLMALFIAIVVWALWPGNRKKFRNAARIPFKDEEAGENGADKKERGNAH